MKIKDLKKEDLEIMSYDDLAYMILKEEGEKMKINVLFQKVCDIMDLPNSVFESKIADFFQLLSTDQRFLMLKEGFWDLRDNHSKKVIIIDEDEDDIEEIIDIEDQEEENEEKEIFEEDTDTDEDEDDLKDFAIINEDDEENMTFN